MMNAQPLPGISRWRNTANPLDQQPAPDERWSDLHEVMTLLNYDAAIDSVGEQRLFRRRRIKAGQPAFLMGQAFDGLYVVRTGSLKTSICQDDGGEHVLSFPMKGDLLGFDGVCNNHYFCEAMALTDCELIRLPAADLFTPGRGSHEIERMTYWAISREIVKEQTGYAISHAIKAEARVARFVRLQSARFAALGYSPKQFILPMTRRDIGSFLSVTLETVSRALSALHQLGIIEVNKREITILSMSALREFEA